MGGLPVVGMIGGGQLARMTHQATIALGVGFRVLADTPADSAALVCRDVVVGDYRSRADVLAFAGGCDVVTLDHEHVPLAVLSAVAALPVPTRPGPHALPFVQDKVRMRERLGELGAPVPAWRPVADGVALDAFAAEHGWPVVVKAATGGYDGKGVWVVTSAAEAEPLFSHAMTLFAEERVAFSRELAAVVARSAGGECRGWPVVETVQRDGICHEVVAPAPGLDPALDAKARTLAMSLARALDVVGVLAVELFEVDGGLLVNELAMRPHNSAHWTMDGARTSQFEQHVRAVLGWPLGETSAVSPVTVMANVLGGAGPDADALGERLPQVLAADPDVRVHLYGKAVRPGRKIGHVNVVGTDVAETRRRARRAAELLRGAPHE